MNMENSRTLMIDSQEKEGDKVLAARGFKVERFNLGIVFKET